MLRRLRHMLAKEFLQMLRDPRMRVMILVLPVFQMLVFAWALTMDVMNIHVAVLDLDNTPTTRRIVQEFSAGKYFRVTRHLTRAADIPAVLDHAAVKAAIHLPAGFENDLQSGRTATVQLLIDGSDSNTASIILGYASRIMQNQAEQRIRGQLAAALGADRLRGTVQIEQRALYNPNLESRHYYVPGLLAVMLIVFGMNLTSIGIVREKEIGTIEQVMVTPITRFEFILGKAIPPVITGYITMTIMLLLAMLFFGISIKGSILLLYALTGIYLASNIGLALLISAISATQQQAFLTAFFIIMPAVQLSGFMFPIHNMPAPVQYITLLNPMRWYLEIIRGIVLKGVGIATLWPSIIGQAMLAAGFMLTATARFRKTMA
jgi:ABC-2 type transport system permease protein